jgi:hypothetical protein
VTVRNSRFVNNSVNDTGGGGLANFGGTVTVRDIDGGRQHLR